MNAVLTRTSIFSVTFYGSMDRLGWNLLIATRQQGRSLAIGAALVLGTTLTILLVLPVASGAAPALRNCGSYHKPHTDVGYERILAKRITCSNARRIVRRWVNDRVPLPKGRRGWNCNSGTVRGQFFVNNCRRLHQRLVLKQRCTPGSCRPRQTADRPACSEITPGSPLPCIGERACGRVPSVSEGVQIKSRVFTRYIVCRTARSLVRRSNRPLPPGWTSAYGSGEGAVYYRGERAKHPPLAAILRRPHVRYSNVIR